MALSNIFAQNVKNPFQALNVQNNAQAVNKKPEQLLAQTPVSIFGANPPQNPNNAAGDVGARAQEIITQVKKMNKIA
jgi:hypothetical protein